MEADPLSSSVIGWGAFLNGAVLLAVVVGLIILSVRGWKHPKWRALIIVVGVLLAVLVCVAGYIYYQLGQTDWSK